MMASPLTPPRSPSSSSPSTPPLPDLPVVEETEPYDLFGIGFGPTHLALAIAFEEEHPGKRALFIDTKEAFSWHSALLLPESRMQISFLKDLATFRNPRSDFTFLSYLYERGVDRLAAFSNVGSWTPSRVEWAGYFAWAAKKLERIIAWSTRILYVQDIASSDSKVNLLKIACIDQRTNTLRIYYTRNLSIGLGAIPKVPDAFAPLTLLDGGQGHVAHTSDYLPTLRRVLGSDKSNVEFNGRFAVIGGGQSSAEVFNDLMARFPAASVDLIYRTSALVPADDSSFVNSKAFDPGMTDEFHQLTPEERMGRLKEFKRANYTCVAPELVESMYKMLYRQRVEADITAVSNPCAPPPVFKHRIIANADVSSIIQLPRETPDVNIELTVSSTLTSQPSPVTNPVQYTAVFLGTGYHRPATSLSFLRGVSPRLPALQAFLQTGDVGEGLVARDYSIKPAPAREDDWRVRIFALGMNERSHGLSDSLLSVGAVRAGEVVRALVGMEPSRPKC